MPVIFYTFIVMVLGFFPCSSLYAQQLDSLDDLADDALDEGDSEELDDEPLEAEPKKTEPKKEEIKKSETQKKATLESIDDEGEELGEDDEEEEFENNENVDTASMIDEEDMQDDAAVAKPSKDPQPLTALPETENQTEKIPKTQKKEIINNEGDSFDDSTMKVMQFLGFQVFRDRSRIIIQTNAQVRFHIDETKDEVVITLQNTFCQNRNLLRFLPTEHFQTPILMITPRIIEGASQSIQISVHIKQHVTYQTDQNSGELFIDISAS